MTDITERLRLRTDPTQMLMCYPARPAPDMLCYEAAAEIERLRSALQRIVDYGLVSSADLERALAVLEGEASN